MPHFLLQLHQLKMLHLEKKEKKIKWPKINKEILIENKINFVVQINGKTRGILNINKGFNEKQLLNMIKEDDKMNNHIKDKTVKNTIFIADKLINIITQN